MGALIDPGRAVNLFAFKVDVRGTWFPVDLFHFFFIGICVRVSPLSLRIRAVKCSETAITSSSYKK